MSVSPVHPYIAADCLLLQDSAQESCDPVGNRQPDSGLGIFYGVQPRDWSGRDGRRWYGGQAAKHPRGCGALTKRKSRRVRFSSLRCENLET